MVSRYLVIVYLICIVLSAKSVFAQTFCVDSEIEIQNALNAAASNSESDDIQIVQGTYLGNFSFSGTDFVHDITIEGGYVKYLGLCVLRTPPPSASQTVLDGGGHDRVMNIENGGSVSVRRLTIQNGYSTGDGAGVRVSQISSGKTGPIEFAYNFFDENHADGSGGGVYTYSSSSGADADTTLFTYNIVRNNTSAQVGGGIHTVSNASSGQSGAIEMSMNTIINNESSLGGGGVAVGFFGATGTGPVLITHNVISRNTVPEDLAEYRNGGGLSIGSNSASTNLGNIDIINNIITDNNADGYGGGVHAGFFSADDSGFVTFTHNTISGNQAGVHGGGLSLNTPLVTQIHNNIVWGNSIGTPYGSDDIYLRSGITVNAHAHYNDYAHISGAWLSESNNIDVNPVFVSGDDYHLQASSPCMDKGTNSVSLPSTDIDGDNRVIGIAPDIGADEIRQKRSTIYFPIVGEDNKTLIIPLKKR